MCLSNVHKFGMRLLDVLKERKIFVREREFKVHRSINYMILIIYDKSSKTSLNIHMYKSKWSFKKKFFILFATLCKVMLILPF